MPVFMITLHAYRSWTEDDPDGYFQRGRHGLRPPDQGLAIQRSRRAALPPRRFTAEQQRFIVDQAVDIVQRRDIRLHAVSCTATHVHLVVSWFGDEELVNTIMPPHDQAKAVASKVKNILATLLSKQAGSVGHRCFSRGCDCTPVIDSEHLNHLLAEYLPKHRRGGGIVRVLGKGDTSA
ncbi:MAG: hypothetical protein ACE37H_15710 [Phycisphaeraceae bacterium]